MGCTAERVAEALRAVARVVAEHREELVRLDREIGDGDHGENLNRGFTALVSKLDGDVPGTPGAVLKSAATTLISVVGGAAGPLYGTAFLRAATSVGDAAELDAGAVAGALRAALEGVVARGKAAVGDKTMVDALTPAVAAASSVAATGGDVAGVLAAAAEAAEQGAESTVPLVARKGRASYLGERSAGHLDPGARSTALLLRTLAGSAR
ncbi:dihydroxyacetone kinase-like protein [Saccharothrix tamanrassetensis]|uniref:Dihydroxyacetone kinase-like protein n=1 Tax=Saccharothrix tamanrassetensis TaxID=1051531 RepID=A0A841CDH5_9PSEU|nr:dihydroxyacetone kinase subunit DhaL [Saccharothrix tamanrassetensis]MBB5955311.1 dihydroxyacetone kinase-like protein [Saccharothrix tamanrassetensis]